MKKSDLVRQKGERMLQLMDEIVAIAHELQQSCGYLEFLTDAVQSAAEKVAYSARCAILTHESLEYVLTDEERNRLSELPAGLIDPRYRGD